MSFISLLSIGRSALQANEKAVDVIGQNIANASTPGYSRQRLDLAAATPESLGTIGQLGRGVQIVDISRVRNAFYDTSWRREAGGQAQYQTRQSTLSQISGVLGEPSDSGLGVSLDNLIDSFNSLASNPTDPTARAVVAANATALTDQFQSINQRLTDINTQIGQELGQATTQVNSGLDDLAQLNVQLNAAQGKAPDLLDRRDLLLDQLSQLVDTRVIDRGNGTVDVALGGAQLVSAGGAVQHLSGSGGGPYQVQYGNPPVAATVSSGQIKGLLDAASTLGTSGSGSARGTGLRGQLDDLALGIVSAVNQIHSSYDPTNNPLQPTITPAPSPLRAVVPFFDPAGVTAGTIALNPTIAADPTQIAAGYSTAPGDTSIALQLSQLRNLVVPIPGAAAAGPNSPAVTAGPTAVLGDYYNGVVAGLGVKTQDAGNRADAESTLVNQIDSQRQDTSGVSIDEEMVKLIQHQQAYAAAARLISTADQMLQDLVNLGKQ